MSDMVGDSANRGASRPRPPPGACDCHMHIYGPPDRYPLAPTATFAPPLALEDDYRGLRDRLGLERLVVVQPTAYGTDNACTMEAVRAFGGAGIVYRAGHRNARSRADVAAREYLVNRVYNMIFATH